MITGEERARTERLLDRRTPYVRWSFYLLCLCIALLLAVSAGVGYWGFWSGRTDSRAVSQGLEVEKRRELAGKLLSAGLTGQAIEQYELYLEEARIPADRKAKISYTIGKLHMDEGRYEEALSWLYRVEMLDPKTELAPEVGSKIVACLERLGRYSQAQYSLDARTSSGQDKEEEFKGSRVVARVGKDDITLQQFQEAIDALPQWMRGSLEDPGRKEALLNQYVAEEILYQKARKLEFDKDPKIRRQAELALRQLMVKQVLDSEVRDKVKVSAEDMDLYYKANRDRYQEREAYRVRFMRIREEALDEVMEALGRGEDFASLARSRSQDEASRDRGGEIPDWIERGLDPIGLGDPEKLWQALAALGRPGLAEPVRTPRGWCLFQIVAHRPQRFLDLEEARERVQGDLFRERVEKTYQELVAQALQAADVKIFPEALSGASAGEEAGTKPPAAALPGEEARGTRTDPGP